MANSTYTFNEFKEYDGVLVFTAAPNQQAGQFMERKEKLKDWEAVYSGLKNHPNFKNIKQGANNHMIMKGAVSIIYTWEKDETINEKDLINFWNLAKANSTGTNFQLIESDAEARRMIINVSFENESNSWMPYPLPYVLDCSGSRMEILEDSTDVLCYVFKENDPDNWTKQHCNIANGETFTIKKEGNEHCYVIFGEAVTSKGKILEALKPYRLTSGDIEVTNNSGNSCKIFRVYK